jgi:hypothetical protein
MWWHRFGARVACGLAAYWFHGSQQVGEARRSKRPPAIPDRRRRSRGREGRRGRELAHTSALERAGTQLRPHASPPAGTGVRAGSRRGRRADVPEIVDVDELVALWDELYLPDHVRRAWADWLAERRGIELRADPAPAAAARLRRSAARGWWFRVGMARRSSEWHGRPEQERPGPLRRSRRCRGGHDRRKPPTSAICGWVMSPTGRRSPTRMPSVRCRQNGASARSLTSGSPGRSALLLPLAAPSARRARRTRRTVVGRRRRARRSPARHGSAAWPGAGHRVTAVWARRSSPWPRWIRSHPFGQPVTASTSAGGCCARPAAGGQGVVRPAPSGHRPARVRRPTAGFVRGRSW